MPTTIRARITASSVKYIRRIFRLSLLFFLSGAFLAGSSGQGPAVTEKNIPLPSPEKQGKTSLEEAIYTRRSIRSFQNTPLSLKEISQILWAAGGKTIDAITGPTRSYPSAGGIYPLEFYLVAGKVSGLAPGIYRYRWRHHTLELLKTADFRKQLAGAAGGQSFINAAPASLVITAKVFQTSSRYGPRGETRYISMDAGHSGQNVSLQAQALGLGAVMVGAFQDKAVAGIIGVKTERPLYIIPIGKPK